MIRQPAWLLWATLPAILIVFAFGLWLRLDHIGPTGLDESWLGLVGLDRGSVAYWTAVTLAEVGGGTGVVICTGLLAAVFLIAKRFRAAIFLVTAMLAGIATSEVLKAIVTRLRPGDQLYESLGYSYPSGHSMGAAALAMSLAIIAARAHHRRTSTEADPPSQQSPTIREDPAARRQVDRSNATAVFPLPFHWSFALAAVWILAMMWSRTALQVHWLTDTIAGALIGIAVAVAVDEAWSLAATRARSDRFAIWLAG
ncbi:MULTISPECIES: phosphatase PAP2 family protein [unclassified Brevibacterium]|uniref:phosphatase PAP2 family protein n=1 Tax=unclassified Brevibacterium TaxID=2614124 RepID=UPI001091D45F|nr:phosphatase PAP2 family protein [Brevibacterium sp. S22]TGD31837.1 phosphatase PAP2 family protein [Brevibacterium sp. S22]